MSKAHAIRVSILALLLVVFESGSFKNKILSKNAFSNMSC